MKPKLVLSAGTSWSGTTPLYYTFAVNHKLCHGGHEKEHGYLHLLDLTEQNKTIDKIKFYSKFFRPKWLDNPDGSGRKGPGRKHPLVNQHSPLVKGLWTQEELKKHYTSPFSIEKYISYYKKHWSHIKHEYKAVADFSNPNSNLSDQFLQKYAPILKEHFDITVVMIFRDPIRRFWSVINARRPDNIEKLFFEWSPDICYSTLYKKWKKHFNVKTIVMEEFWDGKPNEFMGYLIDNIYPNAYVPDLGINAPHISYLNDQWESDIEVLTPDIIERAKVVFAPIYKKWYDTFGYIPQSWTHNEKTLGMDCR
jgi:hypothetical protein